VPGRRIHTLSANRVRALAHISGSEWCGRKSTAMTGISALAKERIVPNAFPLTPNTTAGFVLPDISGNTTWK
jgi:hypothetical protein